jgi:hypothetical protein
MRWFRKGSKAKIPTEIPTKEELVELTRQHKERIAKIVAEIERSNFERAEEMAVTCAEDFKGSIDFYGEAYCRYLAGHSMICQHQKNRAIDRLRSKSTGPDQFAEARISSHDYQKAKAYLWSSSEMFNILARNRKYERNRRLMRAMVLIDLALLESFAENWDQAMAACELSADISKKYEDHEGLQLATELALITRAKKIGTEIFQFADKLLSPSKKDSNLD